MARQVDRTKDCTRADALTRLTAAHAYQELAELAEGSRGPDSATVATGNAVLAGIAAADAICCGLAGQRYKGQDHRAAARQLQNITGDAALAGKLRDLVDLKDTAHYGIQAVQARRAKDAVRKSKQLVDAADAVVR